MSWLANVNNKGGDLRGIWLFNRAKCQICGEKMGLYAKACSNQHIKFILAKSLRNLINYLHKAKSFRNFGCRVSCQTEGGSVCPGSFKPAHQVLCPPLVHTPPYVDGHGAFRHLMIGYQQFTHIRGFWAKTCSAMFLCSGLTCRAPVTLKSLCIVQCYISNDQHNVLWEI